MRKIVFAVAVAVFVLGMAATVMAVPPSVIGADGQSTFTYADLMDTAGGKYQGGYAEFDNTGAAVRVFNGTAVVTNTNDTYATSGGAGPHGGYAAATNKCKVCHAVHRAEGAYYLLRADSQADACDYCHIGGSAHSAKVVYDLNPSGTSTTNGHTLGAGQVPDSSIKQTAVPVTVEGTDVNGNTVSSTVNVRSYESESIGLYRFSRHHSQSPAGTGLGGFKPIGPNSLSCFSCHQPHGAPGQSWQPTKFSATFADPAAQGSGTYKLLRRYPSGSWGGSLNLYGNVDVDKAVKVPETTLTAGFNYSKTVSSQASYNENGVVSVQPVWIAQGWMTTGDGGPAADPTTVNQYTLSVWCADCHNLNIGGATKLAQEELGFKAHTERTHPAPFVGSGLGGPGQCYSCHRNDLSVSVGEADPTGYGMNQAAPVGGTSDGCSQCHYGTRAYSQDMAATSGRESDFPHSGRATDVKLLGSYTASVANGVSYTPVFTQQTIDETNLDAVCIRCHPGIGVHN